MSSKDLLERFEDIYNLGIKAVIRNDEGKILLLQVDHNNLINELSDYWDIPGGRVKKGVTPEQTLIDEVEEETGIKSIKQQEHLASVVANFRIPVGNNSIGLILFVYLCDVENIANIRLSKEHKDYGWFDPKEAASLLGYKYPTSFTQKIAELS